MVNIIIAASFRTMRRRREAGNGYSARRSRSSVAAAKADQHHRAGEADSAGAPICILERNYRLREAEGRLLMLRLA